MITLSIFVHLQNSYNIFSVILILFVYFQLKILKQIYRVEVRCWLEEYRNLKLQFVQSVKLGLVFIALTEETLLTRQLKTQNNNFWK